MREKAAEAKDDPENQTKLSENTPTVDKAKDPTDRNPVLKEPNPLINLYYGSNVGPDVNIVNNAECFSPNK